MTERQWAILLAILALSLVLRLALVAQLNALPDTAASAYWNPVPTSDTYTYKTTSREICEGKFRGMLYYQPGYYAAFLPATYWLTGSFKPLAPALIQTALGTATVFLVFLIGARCFGFAAGALGALLASLSRDLIFYTPYLLQETLFVFFVTLAAWRLLRMAENPSAGRALVAGVVIGAAAACRGNALFLLFLILPWAALRAGETRRLRLACTLLLWLGTCLVLAPFSLYNSLRAGKPMPPATSTAVVLTMANNPEVPPGGVLETFTFRQWLEESRRSNPASGKSFPDAVASGFLMRRMLAWIASSPLDWLEMRFRALLLYFHHGTIENNIVLAYERKFAPLLGFPLLADAWILLPLGLAGFLLSVRSASKTGTTVLALSFIGSMAAVAIVSMLSRYRLMSLPLFCVYAGSLLPALAGRFRVRPSARVVATTAAALFFSFLLGFAGPTLYERGIRSWLYPLRHPGGTAVQHGGEWLITDNSSLLPAFFAREIPTGPAVGQPVSVLLNPLGRDLASGAKDTNQTCPMLELPLPPGAALRKRFVVPPEIPVAEVSSVLLLLDISLLPGARQPPEIRFNDRSVWPPEPSRNAPGEPRTDGLVRPGENVLEIRAGSDSPCLVRADRTFSYRRTETRPSPSSPWSDSGAEILSVLVLKMRAPLPPADAPPP